MKVLTKKQQVVCLSTAEGELYAAVKNRVRGIWDSERGEGPGHCMWTEPTSGHDSDEQRAGQGKTRRLAELVDTRCLQVKKVRHEEGGYERTPPTP